MKLNARIMNGVIPNVRMPSMSARIVPPVMAGAGRIGAGPGLRYGLSAEIRWDAGGTKRITARLDDRQTVSAILDLAQARGWQTIGLCGSDSFKRGAWLQAQVRGMDTEGYRPQAMDMQEAERRRVAATSVVLPAKAPAGAALAKTTKRQQQRP